MRFFLASVMLFAITPAAHACDYNLSNRIFFLHERALMFQLRAQMTNDLEVYCQSIAGYEAAHREILEIQRFCAPNIAIITEQTVSQAQQEYYNSCLRQ